MAFTKKPYCTLDDVRALLDKDSTATSQDDIIGKMIPQAQAAVDEYLGFSFQTDGTSGSPSQRVYDGNGRGKLLIDRCLDLVQVQTQTYTVGYDSGTNAYTRTANTPIDVTADCLLGPNNMEAGFILERLTGYFPLGKQNIVVKGQWGKSATIPDDIKRACARLVVHYVKQMDASYQDQVGDGTYGMLVFKQQFPPDICQLLDKHKPRVFYS